MNLIINTEKVQSLGLTLNEYMILITAYCREFGEELEYSATQETIKKLEEDMYIKMTPKGVVLREKSWKIFEYSKNDKFEEFLNIYPKSVPYNGRERATAPSLNSYWANQLRREWNSITKDNIKLQEDILYKLKYDIDEKSRTGNLMYLPKIDRWLNEKMWERVIINEQKSHEKSI